MLEKAFPHVLRWTGVITALAGLQFLAPVSFLAAQGMAVGDVTGLFFARHWGMLVACFGLLMVLAASRPALRVPVVVAALVEKAALVLMVLLAWNEPALQGLHGAAVFDGACVAVYASWLVLQAGRKPSIDK